MDKKKIKFTNNMSCANCNWFREFCNEHIMMDGHRVDCLCEYNEMFIDKDCFCNHWEEFGEEYYFFRNHYFEILQEAVRRAQNSRKK